MHTINMSAIKLRDVDANYSFPIHFALRPKLTILHPNQKTVATTF